MRLSALTQRYCEHVATYRGHTASSVTTYSLTFQQFIAYVLQQGGTDDLRHFTIETVEGFAHYLSGAGLHPNTVFNRLGHLSSLARYAMTQRDERRRPLMASNPVAHVERPQKQRPAKKLLYAEEAGRIAQVAAVPNEAIARDVWLDTALRVSELCRLNVGDVARDSNGRAVVGVTVKGKGRREERIQIQLGEEVTARLSDWLLRRGLPSPSEPLLTNQAGERYTRSALYQVIVRLGRAAGVTRIKVNPHAIRHLWNLTAREQGVDQLTRSRLLNHADTRTLAEYDHVMPQETAAAREQVRKALRGISHSPDSAKPSQSSLVDFLKESSTSK
jgi:site-specific recombinase XerD